MDINKIHTTSSSYISTNKSSSMDSTNNSISFKSKNVNNISACYIKNWQKNRTINWLNGLGLQLPVPYNSSSSINNITSQNEDVNTTTKYSMNTSKL